MVEHDKDQRPPRTTTDIGTPAASDEYSLTAGMNGPILIQDHSPIQKIAQLNRERVPERVVHAKGSDAFGYFEVTHDVTAFTKANFLGADADRGARLRQALGSGTPVAADDK